jgi:transcriptional regulator with XRE-family HTH domain
MAKRKVRPRPGTLLDLLKQKGMTQMDAAVGEDRVDRKTLAKINRGEEVKVETLQTLARKLRIPVAYFFNPAPAADETGNSFDPTYSVMLRKLNPGRLAELIKGAEKIEWLLNVQIIERRSRTPARPGVCGQYGYTS